MTSEHLFLLVLAVIAVMVVAIILVGRNRQRIKRAVLNRLKSSLEAEQRTALEPEQPVTDYGLNVMTEEEQSLAELERLQELINDRKQVAGDMDISYHLWGFYKRHFQSASPQSLDCYIQDGEWYDVRILQVSAENGLNKFEFELKGARYTFVDDEERQGWRENIKFFSLFLYDDSGRCLIEIPMKMRVDKLGRNYSILSNGPNAFLPGIWINDFINVTLKQQYIRNQEIRAQKHQERLYEIEELKTKFGISD